MRDGTHLNMNGSDLLWKNIVDMINYAIPLCFGKRRSWENVSSNLIEPVSKNSSCNTLCQNLIHQESNSDNVIIHKKNSCNPCTDKYYFV